MSNQSPYPLPCYMTACVRRNIKDGREFVDAHTIAFEASVSMHEATRVSGEWDKENPVVRIAKVVVCEYTDCDSYKRIVDALAAS